MDTRYDFKKQEAEITAFWEKQNIFDTKIDTNKEPFCIVFPPPNANASLHLGHAMYVFEDVMIRYQKLQGKNVFWVAGADHAGIETQFVYEKFLKKQGQSRFDFDRDTLYKNIWNFVHNNRGLMEAQLKRLGFLLDWKKQKFTLDPDIVKEVNNTFKKLFDDNLVYRSNKLVSFCTSCGTSFSDLEVVNKETEGKLFYIKYSFSDSKEHITVATTRPETIFGDMALMVNPKDKRYKKYIGKTVILPISGRTVPVIADSYVDATFGSGVVKVTPSHDLADFEVAKRHNLNLNTVIDFSGKMQNTGFCDGIYFLKARTAVIEKLQEINAIEKITDHLTNLPTCYRCSSVLQPLPKEQWFIKLSPLKEKAIKFLKQGKIKVYPSKFKKQLIDILEQFIDWNISRQIVWGIRIPAYQCTKTNKTYSESNPNLDNKEIGKSWFVSLEKPTECAICKNCNFIQDQDTFDTWFSSSQWPFATLKSLGNEYFKHFYPTSVMETGYDILRAWVSRMIMIGVYETNKEPFKNIFLHGMVRDSKGAKMSKSKGNVINPIDMVEKYGADALRAALIFGTKEGGDIVLSEEKIKPMRNFGNKIWNIARFLQTCETETGTASKNNTSTEKKLTQLKSEFLEFQNEYSRFMKGFKFAKAFDLSYEFIWHRFADFYIEEFKFEIKNNGNLSVLNELNLVYLDLLKCVHPFMPFVTEAVWQSLQKNNSSILNANTN